jgi:hypothetical protein
LGKGEVFTFLASRNEKKSHPLVEIFLAVRDALRDAAPVAAPVTASVSTRGTSVTQ